MFQRDDFRDLINCIPSGSINVEVAAKLDQTKIFCSDRDEGVVSVLETCAIGGLIRINRTAVTTNTIPATAYRLLIVRVTSSLIFSGVMSLASTPPFAPPLISDFSEALLLLLLLSDIWLSTGDFAGVRSTADCRATCAALRPTRRPALERPTSAGIFFTTLILYLLNTGRTQR